MKPMKPLQKGFFTQKNVETPWVGEKLVLDDLQPDHGR